MTDLVRCYNFAEQRGLEIKKACSYLKLPFTFLLLNRCLNTSSEQQFCKWKCLIDKKVYGNSNNHSL